MNVMCVRKRRAARSLAAVLAAGLIVGAGCRSRHVTTGRRVVVLGVDGLDHQLVRELMARGRMPHFDQLAKSGRFSPLATSTPPQSPVAWSTFITGRDPGQHGIFDFIHRDPKTMEPFLSTSRTEAGARKLVLGRWQFPLQSGRVELLRRGEAFWDALERRGIETTIVRMPANFPPSGTATRELSGMGTPDLLGTYGTFSFFTSRPLPLEGRTVSGGVIVPVDVADGVVQSSIEGPDNPYLVEPRRTRVDFTAYPDATGHYVKLVVGDEERLLRAGEWSDWVPVELTLLPFEHLAGEVRFYLKQIEPYFELYASPINIDPLMPALPISTPGGYASELARAGGRYYTQGMPEETKGLRTGVLTASEFLQQARIASDESIRQYRDVLDRFDDGLLFYYFGNIDQVSHMMWRAMDPDQPGYTSEDAPYRTVIEDLYAGIDQLVGETLARLRPADLLVVMSDHGFASWRRSFSLNAWLRDNGYLVVRDATLRADQGLFNNVDWTRTRAYALGLNGLYINVRGREAHGIVESAERQTIAREIARRLEVTIDPKTSARAVSRVFSREDVFQLEGDEDLAPDLIVGYAKGTRSSDDSSLGAVRREVFADNLDAWSGDHCMDPEAVPGILLTSRPLKKAAPSLQTLAAAIVAEFGVEDFPAGPGMKDK
jgi:predicted AlkP superfamily phosphohydrolase/phosphomutase